MQIIPINNAVVYSFSTEQTAFPAALVLDSHAHALWKPSATSGTITLNVTGPGNALCIYNILCDSLTVTVKSAINGGGSTIKTETKTMTVTNDYESRNITRYWMDYAEQAGDHSVVVSLSVSTGYPQIGIIFVGRSPAYFRSLVYGMSQDVDDSSIISDLDAGYRNIKAQNKRDSVSHNVKTTNAEEYHALLRLLTGSSPGPVPLNWSEGSAQKDEYISYGILSGVKGSIPAWQWYTLSFSLSEFI